ncbi:hypothetical protein ACC745_39355, partial [Rhizobium ruizarguesonis]
TVMLVAATPLANFIERNPTIVMLALAFLLMIGTTLIAEGMGFHVPSRARRMTSARPMPILRAFSRCSGGSLLVRMEMK